jgi:hypothetical protein
MKFLFFVYSVPALIVSFVLISSVSFSQKKQFDGYYINLSGDTIKGVIADYKQWNYNPSHVSFIPMQSGGKVSLTALNCKEFHAVGYDTYISYIGARMTNPIEFGIATEHDKEDVYDTISTFFKSDCCNGQVQVLCV